MATTTNYGWTTPDDTALVKDGASAIRSLGTSVDTTTKNLNPSTTLGDIEYRSSTANTNTRLGIGSSGQVLTVSGGVPAWTTPAGSNESYSLINAGGTAMSGSSTITVSSISGMNSLMFFVDGADAPANSQIQLRLNGDTASNYWNNSATFSAQTSYNSSVFQSGTNSGTYIMLLMSNNSDGRYIAAGGIIRGCNSTGIKSITFNGACDGQGQLQQIGTGRYEGTSTISSLSIISSAGNFTGGTLYVYGSA
jgi:hypothetical protein